MTGTILLIERNMRMKAQDIRTAEKFGVLDRIRKLETELSGIERVVNVEFDLNSLESHVWQVIFLLKYDVRASLPDDEYWNARWKIIDDAIAVARRNDLSNSGDRIEDMGEHFYFVRNCGDSWRNVLEDGWRRYAGE